MATDRAVASGYPRWMSVCGTGAIAAALPTVAWRALLGLGFELGTPAGWRNAQNLPGSGTSYVLTLSALQLCAALLTLVLILPHGDRVPPWRRTDPSRRLPMTLVVGCSGIGTVLLGYLCIASAVNWSHVDPFSDAPSTAWAWLCWACYAAAPLWPVLLAVTTVGYVRTRRRLGTRAAQPVST